MLRSRSILKKEIIVKKRIFLWLLAGMMSGGAVSGQELSGDSELLKEILQSGPEVVQEVLQQAEKHRLQILYTQIERDETNAPHFVAHGLRLNTDAYFYPASTIKLPAALLALEKLNELNVPKLDKFTEIRIGEGDYATIDSTQTPSIADYVRRIFLVSDNHAYNCLYEFLGQKHLNESLWQKGYDDAYIIRRLESGTSPEENRITKACTFINNGEVVYEQPQAKNPNAYKVVMESVRQGKGYMRGDSLVREPLDFSYSNYISLASLQSMLRSVIFPEAVPAQQRFDLTPEDLQFVRRYLCMLPRESEYAEYADYADNYVKTFIIGDDSTAAMPENLRIFSKSGQAYGYLIDNAYIVDFENKVEFFLSAVLQVNENQIYNDDDYEYDEIGYPFLASLGRVIYECELQRPRAHAPELSEFQGLADR